MIYIYKLLKLTTLTEPWSGSQYLALQRLTRHRLHIVEALIREKTYMLSNVIKLRKFNIE
ncbi:hypothetical protein CNEO4_2470001 [Clostridium neonatale]|uniref:Uncharacterized protein n=1 Tax=Clostridium neonatale TaxID=137838 RepID=A0AA86JMC6_9CLOT|nr:hypothetical protein CNEO_10349 [Clostridium neonatale]CAI3593828.1 hypothetical protein CNEO4_1640001 [Clostridium neonatale]CAI3594820.1 hypothetical protein CNEO4_1460001 [Clostridium neonatale]CAI3618156.1 hypothetical protein CNEO4_1540001 [Clostridium neonatale]CAI3661878.1 hypothetical protein CNEO4_2470001 [Clostridium neonatale]